MGLSEFLWPWQDLPAELSVCVDVRLHISCSRQTGIQPGDSIVFHTVLQSSRPLDSGFYCYEFT